MQHCLQDKKVNDYDVYFKRTQEQFKSYQYYVDKFNKTHKTTAFVKQEYERDGFGFETNKLVPNGKINIFIQSKGVLADEDAETITDESEPILPKKMKNF